MSIVDDLMGEYGFAVPKGAYDKLQEHIAAPQPVGQDVVPYREALIQLHHAYDSGRKGLGYTRQVEALDDSIIAAPHALTVELTPRPMETAPRDGSMLRLLVKFDEHDTENTEGPSWTIGHNCRELTGEDEWQFAGWCWSHDHFTEGKGAPVGWLPLVDSQAGQS